MSKEKLKKVHLIYGIVLSVLLAVVSVLFIVMCIDIYRNSPERFTRQSVSEHFGKIAVFVCLTIAAIIGGGILSTVAPLERKKDKGTIKDGLVLDRLSKKLHNISDDASAKIEKQRIIRFSMIIVSVVLVVGATIGSLVHVLTKYEANIDITKGVLQGWLAVVGYFFAPTAYLIVTAYICKRSIKKELEIVKNELKNEKTAGGVYEKDENDSSINADTDAISSSKKVANTDNNIGPVTKLTNELGQTVKQLTKPKKWHKIAFYSIFGVLACTAITFVVIGIATGGTEEVVRKAIAICKECIGMG